MTRPRSAAELAYQAHKAALGVIEKDGKALAKKLDYEDLRDAVSKASSDASGARRMTALAYDRELDGGGTDHSASLALSRKEDRAEVWFNALYDEFNKLDT